MKQLSNYMAAAFLLLSAVACTEEAIEGGITSGGKESTVNLSLNVVPETGSLETRALGTDVSIVETKIKDFLLMVFDEKGEKKGAPRYYEYEETASSVTASLILPTGDVEYTVVAVANTHDKSLETEFAKAATLNDFKKMAVSVKGLNSLHSASGYLLMSGTTQITANTGNLDINFYRNVAKLTVTVKNEGNSGVQVKSVQIRNVPAKQFYADCLRAETPVPAIGESPYLDFSVDECVLSPGSDVATLNYYLPRNCRGKGTSTTAYEKNKEPIPNSTYVEVIAEKGEKGGGTLMRYRFYLGENMNNDYNVISNHHYTLPIVITGEGSQADSRVEDLGKVTLLDANSYIVNPLPTLTAAQQQVYALPATTRVNNFWDLNIPDEVDMINKKIGSETEWVAEVIWQDVPRQLITFCDEEGVVASNTTDIKQAPYVFETKGLGYLYFKPLPDAKGNVLIGVRKAGAKTDEYLWSWHLWITDYAPDEQKAGWVDGQYIYGVSGGEVHRYEDAPGNTVWSETYKDRYIMDRNLGAMTASYNGVDNFHKVTGLMYQFGRKDPFPSYTSLDKKTKLYNIKGEDIAGQTETPYQSIASTADDYVKELQYSDSPVKFSLSVQKPYTIYTIPTSTNLRDWVEDNPYGNTTILWNNPEGTGKSLFDPCPQGWKVPEANVWNMFDSNSLVDDGTASSSGFNFYICKDKETGVSAYYPFAGIRHNSANLIYVYDQSKEAADAFGYYWSSKPNSLTNSYRLNIFNDKTIKNWQTGIRSYAFSVRCVKEK